MFDCPELFYECFHFQQSLGLYMLVSYNHITLSIFTRSILAEAISTAAQMQTCVSSMRPLQTSKPVVGD